MQEFLRNDRCDGGLEPIKDFTTTAEDPLGASKADPAGDRMDIEAKLLRAKCQFSGISAATAATSAYGKVGAVQFKVSRMYRKREGPNLGI